MSSPNIMETFETAFHNCLTLMTNQEFSNINTDQSEIKLSVDQALNKLHEAARLMECFFIQKRLILTANQDTKDDVEELKNELQRKEQLVQRQHDKFQNWMTLINKSYGSSHGSSLTANISSSSTPSSQITPQGTISQSASVSDSIMNISSS